ncbi:hypothetical protein Tco_1128346 [Tanacetum coccineum]
MDSLALMSNVSHQQYYSQSSTTPTIHYVHTNFADKSKLDFGLSPTGTSMDGVGAAGLRSSEKSLECNPGHARQNKMLMCKLRENRGWHCHEEKTCNFNVDNVFQADDCDAFNSDVDEAPTAQTMFMANLSSADLVYDEAGPSYDSDILMEVANGYKNPLCLTSAKQVQPALYNGYEIIKNNHVPALVHNTEDTLEIAKITRRKMNDKVKDPECVTHKVKIAPPDY